MAAATFVPHGKNPQTRLAVVLLLETIFEQEPKILDDILKDARANLKSAANPQRIIGYKTVTGDADAVEMCGTWMLPHVAEQVGQGTDQSTLSFINRVVRQ